MTIYRFLALSVTTVFAAQNVKAGLFKLANRTYGGATAEQQAVYDVFLNQLENEVNANLPNTDATKYLRGIADSTATAGSGIGTDYASPFDLFIFGPQVGAGAKLGKGNSAIKAAKGDVKAENIAGIAVQGGVMGGFNLGAVPNIDLGFIETRRIKAFAHFFTYKGDIDKVTIKSTGWGFHLQYKAVEPIGLGIARWNGVDFTTGLRAATMKAGLVQEISENLTQVLSNPVNASVTANFSGTARVNATSKVYTVPLEISTSGRLLYFLGAFGGLGADLNYGSASATASASGPVSITGAPHNIGADASLDLGQKKRPHLAEIRAFVGPHFEFGVGSLYLQYTQAFINKTVGINVGLKAFW